MDLSKLAYRREIIILIKRKTVNLTNHEKRNLNLTGSLGATICIVPINKSRWDSSCSIHSYGHMQNSKSHSYFLKYKLNLYKLTWEVYEYKLRNLVSNFCTLIENSSEATATCLLWFGIGMLSYQKLQSLVLKQNIKDKN